MKKLTIQRIVILFICVGGAASALADLEFGPKELVLAGANPIEVPGRRRGGRVDRVPPLAVELPGVVPPSGLAPASEEHDPPTALIRGHGVVVARLRHRGGLDPRHRRHPCLSSG